jgi:hypothetical protein
VLRNLELATSEELETMANDLFKMPKHRERGYLAELMLKEIMRRGFPESEGEKMLNDMKDKDAEDEKESNEKIEKSKEKSKSKEKKSENGNAD